MGLVGYHDSCIAGFQSTLDRLRQVIHEKSIRGIKHCLMAVAGPLRFLKRCENILVSDAFSQAVGSFGETLTQESASHKPFASENSVQRSPQLAPSIGFYQVAFPRFEGFSHHVRRGFLAYEEYFRLGGEPSYFSGSCNSVQGGQSDVEQDLGQLRILGLSERLRARPILHRRLRIQEIPGASTTWNDAMVHNHPPQELEWLIAP
jgi:hypothetical protein